jgi:hypothetical protein
VLDGALQDVRDGLDAAMRVPRKAGQVIGRPLIAEIVEEEERVVLARVAEPERAAELHACAFHGRL